MKRYCKVLYGLKSGADSSLVYKLDEVNVSNNWNINEKTPEKMGGFNYSTENKIFRYLIRGDVLYSVLVPSDAEVVEIPSKSCPKGVYRTNKIILSNPRPIDDGLAMHLYKISKLPKMSYYKALAGCALRGYRETCYELIRDRIRITNVSNCLKEIEDFVKPGHTSYPSDSELYYEILEYLKEIKDPLLISRFCSKKPYYKELSDDHIINLTGESGSGKTYYREQFLNDDKYIIVDTDRILGGDHFDLLPYEVKLRKYLLDIFKDEDRDITIYRFDDMYKAILDFFKDEEKTIVIDSAQYRNIRDYGLIKGQVVVIRTSVEESYNRCIKRYIDKKGIVSEEELNKYKERKKGMFTWYHSINEFIKIVDQL